MAEKNIIVPKAPGIEKAEEKPTEEKLKFVIETMYSCILLGLTATAI